MEDNNGGSAFPSGDGYYKGMTLRDWFAGQALANLPMWEDGVLRDAGDAAFLAYDFADAMLKERAK